MNLAPVDLQHGERYGRLTVLAKVKTRRGWRYRVGCDCGYSGMLLRARQLIKADLDEMLQRAEMAADVTLPIERFRDLVLQAMEAA